MAAGTPSETWTSLQERVTDAVKNYFPFEGRGRSLVLNQVHFDENEAPRDDIRSQEKAKEQKKTWGVPVYADVSLVDKATGKTIDRSKVKLLTLPKPTNRFSYIVDGSEWQVDNLWRLRSGVYAHVKQNGEFETEFNLNKPFVGQPRIKIPFDPESRQFKFNWGSANPSLYSVLKILGVPDEDMKKAWGEDIYKANVSKDPNKEIEDFYGKLAKKSRGLPQATTFDQKAAVVYNEFAKTGLREDTTKLVFGKPFTHVNGEALLLGSKRILGVTRGDHPPDDRNSLVFKTLHGADDFIFERLMKPQMQKTLKGKVQHNIDRQGKVRDIISGDLFNRPVKEFFTRSMLSRNPDQVNPLEMISNNRTTTIMAEEGGIKNEQSVTDDMKLINPSHFGFLDPIHTPESERTGISLHLPIGVRKQGNDPVMQVFDLKEKKFVRVTPAELHAHNVLLPDQVTIEGGKIKPIAAHVKMKDPKSHEIVAKPFGEARYMVTQAAQLFDEATNLIPFLQNNQGNRTMTASRQGTQAMALHNREQPLVQVQAGGSKTWEALTGTDWSHRSLADGKVVEIKHSKENGHPESIIVQDAAGKKHETQIYNHFPLNDSKTFIHSTPLVKVGDQVTKGQTVADSNFTRGGALSLGTNLRVAYIPYKGYNFEDGIVISNSAAKKLTSEHLHRKTIEVDPDRDEISKAKFLAYAGTVSKKLSKEQVGKLGTNGIIQVGQKVEPGDVLIAAVGKKEFTGETSRMMNRLSKKAFNLQDRSVTWDSDHPGEVVKVVQAPNGKGATVYVKTLEPAEIGDKIVGRHGNKAIITRILADHEMPRIGGPDGEHVQVLMNPSGVPTRINLGQMLETAASKVAKKTGQPYVVNNFAGPHVDYTELVKSDLKKHGLSDQEELFDPQNKKKLGDVLTGNQYIFKLKHQVEKKLAVRSGGQGSYTVDHAPKGTGAEHPGQGIGQLEFYALLAHGARANLREMATHKSDQHLGDNLDPMNHVDFWDRVRTGQPLPAPKPTFAYKKFENLLTGLGVNIHKQGNELQLMPLTDKGVLALSHGEIKDGGRVLRGKDAKELEKGLFDPKITGGLPDDKGKGLFWSHIALAEPTPNPIFVGSNKTNIGPAVVLSGLKFDEFEAIAKGHKTINGMTGGNAINEILKKIDVKKELAKTLAELPKMKGPDLNKANRKAKYLMALDKLNMKPHEAYMMNVLPVLPPAFRPIVPMPDGSLRFDDINQYYRSIALLNDRLKNPIKELGGRAERDVREQLYDAMRAYAGLGGHPVYESNRAMKGILDVVAGDEPKHGYFQKRLVKRRQDLSMRSTIIPDPTMHLDHVGLPKDAAMELYKPFVVRELGLVGMNPMQALKAVKENKDIAWKALERALDKRPVLLKRDPALHKFSIMAFKPKMVEGKAIQIHPLVTAGYNADFDGDCAIGPVLTCNFSTPPPDSGQENEMPHNGKIASFQVIEIRDFPRLPESAITKESGVVEYDVPPNVYVPAYNNGKMQILPVTKFSIHPNCEEWVVKSRNGREITCSSDHSLALLDPDTLTVTKAPPRDSIGRCFPILRGVEEPGLYSKFCGAYTSSSKCKPMLGEVPANLRTGWFIGATVGDGWVTFKGDVNSPNSQSRSVDFASGVKGEAVRKEWESLASEISAGATVYTRTNEHEFEGSLCVSKKTTVSSTALGVWLEPLIGKKAHGKHLPPRFLEMPTEFRRGLLAGLLDTDGTVNWNGRGQFQCSYTTISERLSGEIMLLAVSLGLVCNRTESENRGKPVYVATFSIRPMQEATWLKLFSPHKQKALEELRCGRQVENGRNDFVPVTEKAREELLAHLRELGASVRPPNRNAQAFSLYTVLNQKKTTVTRETASNLHQMLKDGSRDVSEYLSRWLTIALDASVGWDVVEEASSTGHHIEMYDLTVPDAWTFTMANGAVVWDTMSAFVPLTDEAVLESRKMFPSNNLFSSTHGGIMYEPTQEALLGLHLLTKWGSKSGKTFPNFTEAQKAKDKGVIGMTDVIKVGGKETTLGRMTIVSHLPDEYKKNDELLHAPGFILRKKDVKGLLGDIAKKDPKNFAITVDHLKDLGNEYAYSSGFSFGLKDLDVQKTLRASVLKPFEAEAKVVKDSHGTQATKDAKTVEIYSRATDEMVKQLLPHLEKSDNKIYTMVYSGARGSVPQFRQIAMAPMLMKDGSGRTIPEPVKKSYSEGLDVGDYWTTLHGARMGTLQKVLGTSDPGALTKEIANVMMSSLITSHDCGTTSGIAMDASDPDIHDRVLARPVKLGKHTIEAGAVVTPEITAAALRHKQDRLVVRSPLKCSHGQGICAKCYGLNENGSYHELGTNIGVIAGHSMGEPATQLAMDSFHTGGVAASRGAGAVDKFTRLNQLLNVPKTLPHSATLSMIEGPVQKIELDKATNGHFVHIGNQKHYVPAGLGVTVKSGQLVRRGDTLSEGPTNPRELLPLTDIHTVQNYLTNELYNKIYKDEHVKRRNIETVVRSLTNLSRVEDPGDSDHVHGDVVLRTVIDEHNRGLKPGELPVVAKPILRSANQTALDHHEDWMARLNFQRLRQTILEGAARGWKSDLHGTNPVPGYAFGAEFGKGTKDKPHNY